MSTAYGNGVITDYAYDPRLRLTGIDTYRSGDLANPLVSYSYTFDGASNIRRIDDLRPGTVAPPGDARRNTQIFGYDDLYRKFDLSYPVNLAIPYLDNGEITLNFTRRTPEI